MAFKLTQIIIAILATWRISAALFYEYTFATVRDRAGVHYLGSDGRPITFWGKQLSCFWCVTTWVGSVVGIIAMTPAWPILVPFAISGGAVLLSGGGRTVWRLTKDDH